MKRYYFAVTNACNRSCELCSCYSDPRRKTFLSFEKFKEILPNDERFEVQLEGGEPLLHPNLEDMINYAQDTGRCDRVVLGTNAVLLPFQYEDERVLDREASINSIKSYFLQFSSPFSLKPSINYHLIEKDSLHLDKAEIIRDAFIDLCEQDYDLKFNVRRRRKPLSEDDDQSLVDELETRNLTEFSNIFFYQRYGQAKERSELDQPFIIPNPVEFHLISPDGKDWGIDLVARSESMRDLE